MLQFTNIYYLLTILFFCNSSLCAAGAGADSSLKFEEDEFDRKMEQYRTRYKNSASDYEFMPQRTAPVFPLYDAVRDKNVLATIACLERGDNPYGSPVPLGGFSSPLALLVSPKNFNGTPPHETPLEKDCRGFIERFDPEDEFDRLWKTVPSTEIYFEIHDIDAFHTVVQLIWAKRERCLPIEAENLIRLLGEGAWLRRRAAAIKWSSGGFEASQ